GGEPPRTGGPPLPDPPLRSLSRCPSEPRWRPPAAKKDRPSWPSVSWPDLRNRRAGSALKRLRGLRLFNAAVTPLSPNGRPHFFHRRLRSAPPFSFGRPSKRPARGSAKPPPRCGRAAFFHHSASRVGVPASAQTPTREAEMLAGLRRVVPTLWRLA